MRRLGLLLVLLVTVAWMQAPGAPTSVHVNAALVSSDPCLTATCYYLDPDVSAGTHVGTQANPFQTQAQMWTAVNTTLAAGTNVYVYCSARDASADTDQLWPVTVQIYQKTTTGTARFTLDGSGFYNSNDTTPSWSAYSGTSKCRVQRVYPMDGSTHVKRNNVTIRKLHTAGTVDKTFAVCGDNWIVEYNDIEHTSAATGDPLFILMPTADSTHEGSSDWCPSFTNALIQYNDIHDSFGELMYLGGAGCSTFSTANAQALGSDCGGVPGHDHVTITNNHLYNCGSRGSQGDCIDFKAAHSYFTITQNRVEKSATNTRCLVTQGSAAGVDQHMVIERNVFDCQNNTTEALMAFSDSWGIPNGWQVRNNIFKNATGGSEVIQVYHTQSSAGLQFDNNDFYNNSTVAIHTDALAAVPAGSITIRNNAMLKSGGGAEVSFSSTSSVTATNNAYGGTWSGTCTACVSGLTSAAFTNAATGDFTLPGGSALRSVGTDLSGTFTTDYAGTTRVAPWDIGAYAR